MSFLLNLLRACYKMRTIVPCHIDDFTVYFLMSEMCAVVLICEYIYILLGIKKKCFLGDYIFLH